MHPTDPATTALRIPLDGLTGRTQLLQRQILRASGLVQLERDQMLGNVAAIMLDIQHLDVGITGLTGRNDLPHGTAGPDVVR